MSEGQVVEVSATAAKLWDVLTMWPGTYHVEELTSQLQTSKAGLSRALMELEEANLISTEIEEDY